MDWNNDGNIGIDDLMLTEMILEDDEEHKDGGGNKPNGSCLSVFLLLIVPIPILLLLFI